MSGPNHWHPPISFPIWFISYHRQRFWSWGCIVVHNAEEVGNVILYLGPWELQFVGRDWLRQVWRWLTTPL